MRTCVFCGGFPLTLEHVFPQWLRQFSAPQSFIQRKGSHQPPYRQTVLRKNAQGKIVKVQEARGTRTPNIHEVKVKSVCAACNNGWMSRLESSIKPTLEKMVKKTPPVPHLVSPQAKLQLAAWAYKCFLMYDQYLPAADRVFVDGDFTSFMKTRRPPTSVRLYLGISNSPWSTVSMWHQPHLLVLDPHPDPQTTLAQPYNTASSFMGIEGIYFIQQYFKPDIPWTAANRHIWLNAQRGIDETPAQQIWPADNRPLKWPPHLTSVMQTESARLALYNVIDSLPPIGE
ncbi:hypothetical protein OHC50_08115 [Paenarthrobacter ilicis]|uniref:hypothetical protein n=1 Tax=Paenarthrobacter ilicis TaxID=43665 RepID=UPI003009DADF